MTTRIAINGFGRIGRLVFRAALERKLKDIEIVAINDLSEAEDLARLLKYDSVHGNLTEKIEVKGDRIEINGESVRVCAERDPANLPWKEEKIDIVFECTGRFRTLKDASLHVKAGAKKVLISAPGGENVERTVVYGVNHHEITADDVVISNASCTTNCLAPVAAVLDNKFGIKDGFATTIHAYTSSQNIVDGPHKDARRSRAAALSMIPASTGAAKALGLVIPKLAGKLDGAAVRIPTPNVSLVDLVVNTSRKVTVESVNAAMEKASRSRDLKGILNYTEEQLVSIDYNHDPASSTFDADSTRTPSEKSVRIVSWYDNEWGFSNRMLDTARVMASFI